MVDRGLSERQKLPSRHYLHDADGPSSIQLQILVNQSMPQKSIKLPR